MFDDTLIGEERKASLRTQLLTSQELSDGLERSMKAEGDKVAPD